ncbi:hypothetical protein BZA77DRAFT_363268 [Pyronema omphalodes]|nr:hypothetical protein BZA77DRAFT_363268 [Pyronema omphalodes]
MAIQQKSAEALQNVQTSKYDIQEQTLGEIKEEYSAADSETGRRRLTNCLLALRPVPGKPIAESFSTAVNLRRELKDTTEAISDNTLRKHILIYVPDTFRNLADMISRENGTANEAMKELKEYKATLAMITNKPSRTTDVDYSRRHSRSRSPRRKPKGALSIGPFKQEDESCSHNKDTLANVADSIPMTPIEDTAITAMTMITQSKTA